MLTSIDHIVIAVNDLAAASAAFAEAGFTVIPGGSHEQRGTHNALIAFQDGSYLELIAIEDPDRAKGHPWFARMAGREGFVTYAVGADPIDYEVERLRSLSLEVGDVQDGGRRRLDGQQVAWRSATIASDQPVPFLIQDVSARNLRVPGQAAAHHPNGVRGTAGLTLIARDLDAARRVYGALFSAPVAALDHGYEGVQDAWRFYLHEYWIDLIAPGEPGSPTGVAHAADGDGIYQIALAVRTGPEFPPGHIEIDGYPSVRILTMD